MFGFGKSKAQKEINRLNQEIQKNNTFFKKKYSEIENDPSLYKWQKQKRKKDLEKLEIAHGLKTSEKMKELKSKLK